MWRRTYLFLILVRLYFALSSSYLHPDENFQGPEVVAARIFSYPVHLTWEFTSEKPIRSVLPLYLLYGWPMLLLHGLWKGVRHDEVPPKIVFWTLRLVMFMLSFVLEDWALHDLIASPRRRRLAILLVTSSYVTWTYQTHTFSNSLETLLLLWSLLLVERIVEAKRSLTMSSATLAFLVVLGTFNRVTFLAYLLPAGLKLLPHLRQKAFTFCILILVGLVTSVALIVGDTLFYKPDLAQFTDVFRQPVITPLNSLLYNTSVDNLREHGLHPRFQHVLVNLPQLLGPAYFGIIFSRHNSFLLFSALSGIALLSVIPHQEARFLLPAVPLLLSSIQLPKRHLKFWIGAWVIFNCVMGVLTGIYHQGGVIPAQLHIAGMDKVSQVFWWKSYRPPTWLLNGKAASIQTTVLMGMPGEEMLAEIDNSLPSCGTLSRSSAASALTALLVAPQSAVFLDKYSDKSSNASVELQELWRHKQHINLDDLDIPEDGLGPTWRRVLGRRGLVVWSVTRRC